jgi:16S rRNA (uracil1498-N3)-methyltransferase
MKTLLAYIFVIASQSNPVSGNLLLFQHSSPAPAPCFICRETSTSATKNGPFVLYHRWNRSQFELRGSQDSISSEENAHESISQYNTLPRIYVGSIIASQQQAAITPSEGSSLLEKKSIIQLSMQQTHYLSKVMRLFAKMKKGNDPPLVRVFDGINGEWLCEIFTPPDDDTSDVNNDNQRKRRNRRDDILLQARCTHQLREQNTKILNLSSEDTSAYIPTSPWLFFAPIKKQRAKRMVEKCTELGVQLFCPILTEYTDTAAVQACIGNVDILSNTNSENTDVVMYQDAGSKAKKKSRGDAEKLSLVACEASEQCERLSVPSFVTTLMSGEESHSDRIMTVEQLLQAWTDSESSLGNDRLLSILEAVEKASELGKEVAFLVGPEGGWSSEEEAWFDTYSKSHLEKVMGVSLGSNVLRAETASILAIGAVALWSSSK